MRCLSLIFGTEQPLDHRMGRGEIPYTWYLSLYADSSESSADECPLLIQTGILGLRDADGTKDIPLARMVNLTTKTTNCRYTVLFSDAQRC